MATKLFDGKAFEDRVIVVSVARPREDRRPNQGSSRGGFQRY